MRLASSFDLGDSHHIIPGHLTKRKAGDACACPTKSQLMLDQNPTLEYGRPTPRHSLRRFAVALSIVIGVAVTLTTLCCAESAGGYDPVRSFISRLAFDRHLILFLPPLAIIGVAIGTIAWIKSQSTAALTGLVLCMIAFFGSMGVSAIHLVIDFWWRH